MAPLLYRLLGPAKAPTPHGAPTPQAPPMLPPPAPPPPVLLTPPPPDLSMFPAPSPPPVDSGLDEALRDAKELYG